MCIHRTSAEKFPEASLPGIFLLIAQIVVDSSHYGGTFFHPIFTFILRLFSYNVNLLFQQKCNVFSVHITQHICIFCLFLSYKATEYMTDFPHTLQQPADKISMCIWKQIGKGCLQFIFHVERC